MAATAPTGSFQGKCSNLPSPLISKPLRFCLPELPFKHISSPHPLSASPEPPPPPPSSPPRATPPSLSASGRPSLPPPPPCQCCSSNTASPLPHLPPRPPTASFPLPQHSNPPKPLRIWSPKPASATALPVLLFQHGFSAQTIYYSRLLSRVASHGFIVVAPQVGRSNRSSAQALFYSRLLSRVASHGFIVSRPRVISWLRSHLSSTLSNRFKLLASPNWSKFAIAGHSRGAFLSRSILCRPLPSFLVPSHLFPSLLFPSPWSSPCSPHFVPHLQEQRSQASPHLSNPPRPLRIWSPKPATATALPVLLFQHGFSAQTSMYSQLLTRIAKHGYIVVAPQMYPVTAGYNTAPEMRGSANVIGWLRKRLAKVLANRLKVKAVPDWDKLAISGHSRGAYFGHKYYYSDLADSAYHVVMPRYGHADFNNDMRVTVNVCPGGQKKVKARVATAGLVVAFLKAKLEADSSDLDDVLANPGHAPVTLSPVESK
ncbi:unnamed protein product [Closterium sp. NIES-65]|nr:unnamed protein product [Closterium sp. NIES-65]